MKCIFWQRGLKIEGSPHLGYKMKRVHLNVAKTNNGQNCRSGLIIPDTILKILINRPFQVRSE
jgi:hypothetical protein